MINVFVQLGSTEYGVKKVRTPFFNIHSDMEHSRFGNLRYIPTIVFTFTVFLVSYDIINELLKNKVTILWTIQQFIPFRIILNYPPLNKKYYKKIQKYWKIYPIHVHPYYIFFISRYSGIYVIASYRWAMIGFNINRKCTIKR